MKELTGLYPTLARAYEIMLVSKTELTLGIVYNEDEYPKAPEDIRILAEYYNVAFVPNPDITVELYKPPASDMMSGASKFESLHNVKARASEATLNTPPLPNLGETERALMKTAIERLGFGLHDVVTIEKISVYIAQLENSKLILPYHIAEAINYRAYGGGLKKY